MQKQKLSNKNIHTCLEARYDKTPICFEFVLIDKQVYVLSAETLCSEYFDETTVFAEVSFKRPVPDD